jgi:hypothetical protein
MLPAMPWAPIATRTLSVVGHPRRRVVVEIGAPFQVDPEWRCPYRIRGAGLRRARYACGEDAVQALLLSFVAVRAELLSSGMPLAWLSDQPGDVGFPSLAPMHAGFTFQRRVERLMEQAVTTEARLQIRAGKARQRARR